MASSQDGNLGLWSGYTPGDNGWTAQHNTNWDALDAFVQATVIDVAVTTPPGSPANGASYIVPAGATGAWASQTNKVAVWVARNSAWTFYSPKNGWMVYSQATAAEYVYNGSAWVVYYSQKLSVPQDYISGLKMVWNSATSISVTTGSAYIPSLGRLSLVNATLTLSSLSLTASTWYHLYLYENAGTPTLECVTTAPAAAYFGTARAKTGDTSRRYIGSVLTDGSGNIYNFRHDAEGAVYYRVGIDTFRVLVGNATTATSVSCSSAVPVTSTKAFANIINNDTTHAAWIGNADMVPSSTNYLELIGIGSSGTTLATTIVLDSTQSFQYLMASGAAANLVVRLKGYTFER